MSVNVELIAASIRLMLEGKGAEVYPTYPPTDSTAFGDKVGADYVKFICLTQRVIYTPLKVNHYLFYRNKLTRQSDTPEFSSVEFGFFHREQGIGNVFTSHFKIHKVDPVTNVEYDDKEYIAKVVEAIQKVGETI